MKTNNDTASQIRGIADVIWEVMRKEHTLSNGARTALGGCVADLEDVIKKMVATDHKAVKYVDYDGSTKWSE